MRQKNILVCVSGLTPQIITETLYCLNVKKKIQVDELYILTTARGRDVILGLDKSSSTPKSPLKKEIHELCEFYKIKKPKFENNDEHIIVAKEESIELYDVRTDKDNILFPNKVMDFIRKLTADDKKRIFCSISGGRKTMSVHLAFALSIFGRSEDKLYHILTSEENEFKDFYPKTKKDGDLLEMAEIPFVRLRTILGKELKEDILNFYTYDQIVKETQKSVRLLSAQYELIIDIRRRELKFKNNKITLEPMEFAFYYFFVDEKIKGNSKINIYQITSSETAKIICDFLFENYRYYYLNSEKREKLIKSGIGAEIFRSKRSKINKKIEELINDKDLNDEFIIKSERIYADTHYFINADINKFKII